MRVLHFLHSHGHQGGDALANVSSLASMQAQSGHQVGLIYVDEDRASSVQERLAKAQKFCRLGVSHININKNNPVTKTATTLLAIRQSENITQECQADLLHGHGQSGGQLARFVQKTRARKKIRSICVYSPHGSPLHSVSQAWPLSTPEPKLWEHTTGIIFESNHCQQNYVAHYGHPPCSSRMIYDGLAPDEFAPRQIIDMATDFFYVGSLTREQGLDTMVRALARLKKSHTTGALIIGSGPGEKELRAQVSRYGLSHNVFFNAPLGAKTAFLKGGCLVLPANDSSIPTIALRAGAAGVPMILTDVGGIREMVGPVKIPLIPPKDTEALQEQLVAYLAHPQVFLGRAAALKQRIAQHFTLERMNAEVEAFYQNLAI